MPRPKYMSVVERLLKQPVFTSRDLVAFGVPQSYVGRLVDHLIKSRRISRIERGKFTAVKDPLVVAPFIKFPSYVSMFSALFLRNAISQVPQKVQIVTTRTLNGQSIKFEEAGIRFFRVKPGVFFGYGKLNYEGFKIPVASVEKALVDLAYFGFESVGELKAGVDKKMIDEYLRIVGKDSVRKRVKRWLSDSVK